MAERIVTVGGPDPTRLLSNYERNVGGTEFYVGPNATGAGDDDRNGRSEESSMATFAAAQALCTADKCDIIHFMPGHAETISAAAGMAVTKAGISIIGHGHGTLQPTVTLDTIISADLDIDAANVTFQNINFVANFVDITAAIDINATDCTFRGCRFTEASGKNALIWLQDAAAMASNRITVEACQAIAIDTSNTHFINFAGTGDGHRIVRNELIGDWGTMAVGGAGIVTYILIDGNLIANAATTVDACINLPVTTTGVVVRNLCGGGAAVVNGITATACTIAENYYQIGTSDLSGVLDPANA